MKRLSLSTPQQVRKSLSRIINMTLNGEIDPRTANTLILGCNAILSSIRTDEQEKAINELSEILDNHTKEVENR